jgi:hypothetical protein
MIKINALDNKQRQIITQIFEDVEVVFTFEFYETIRRWVVSFTYNLQNITIIRNNIPILPNQQIFHKWRNLVPFEMLCISNDNLPPIDIEAFTLGNCSGEDEGLFLLTKNEIEELTK